MLDRDTTVTSFVRSTVSYENFLVHTHEDGVMYYKKHNTNHKNHCLARSTCRASKKSGTDCIEVLQRRGMVYHISRRLSS